MEPPYAALPQRAPRLRRQDCDAAERNAAAAAAADPAGGSEKRARDAAEPAEEAELARQNSRRSQGEPVAGTVVVAWSVADAASHYECACLAPQAQRQLALTALLARARADLDHTADIQLHACAAAACLAFRPPRAETAALRAT